MKFGIELEMTAAIIAAAHPQFGSFYNYVLTLLKESGINNWRLDEDASCGNEFVSPPLEGVKGWAQVEQVLHCVQVAKEAFGFKQIIGNDSGVHFHFDANDLVKTSNRSVTGLRNILLLGALIEPLWFSMNPGARFDTNFAAPLNFNMFQMMRARDMLDLRDIWFRPYQGVPGHQDSYRIKDSLYMPGFVNNVEAKPNKYDWTRYHGLNFVSIFKHGTIEFRYTHGSFDSSNITMWYEMYRKVVEAAKEYRTRDIVIASPVNLNTLKLNSIPDLQSALYADLKLVIEFLFQLIEQDVNMLLFILKKIIKYNQATFPKQIIPKILNYTGDFDTLMNMIKPFKIESIHFRRNQYRYNPPHHLVAQINGGAPPPPIFNEAVEAGNFAFDDDPIDEEPQ